VRKPAQQPTGARERPSEPTSGARSGGAPPDFLGAGAPTDRGRQARKGPPGAATESPADLESIPQEVRERFVNLGRKYFLPAGELAFQDYGHKLTTPSENTEIVRSLIKIARARGWQDITVSGTESFRRAAWQHAVAAQLSVRGYTPTPLEEAQLARTLARRQAGDPDLGASEREEESRPQNAAPVVPAEPPTHTVSPRRQRERVVFGELLEHGRENFRFSPHEDVSYFVKIKTARGPEILWGKDLERALRESKTQPQIGERVGVRQVGQEQVTVQARKRDEDGHVIREQPLKTHRNAWLVETERFFKERAEAAQAVLDPRIAPRRALESHPQLSGTYLALGAAEKLAAERFEDPEDRRRFVAIARAALSHSIERGEPLLSPRLHEHTPVASRRREPTAPSAPTAPVR
jgi:Large polyvalent protein-associated domain 7